MTKFQTLKIYAKIYCGNTEREGGNVWHTITDGNEVSVRAENGEEIERFESSGCLYNDLGCCQGCPTCHLGLDDSRYEEPVQLNAGETQEIYDAEWE